MKEAQRQAPSSMADVYIVYSNRSDAGPQAASRLAQTLTSAGWTVWLDDRIVGNFGDEIRRQLGSARCVVAVWSSGASESPYVCDELDSARRRDVPIIGVRVDDCEAPFGYGQISAVDLRGWSGSVDHPEYRKLLRKLSSVVPHKKPARATSIAGGALTLPASFFSVSSYETRLQPLGAVKVLRLFEARAVLISAYDLHPTRRPDEMMSELTQLHEQGAYVIVDSGNYEAERKGEQEAWTPAAFAAALEGIPHDSAFSFDVMDPPGNSKDAIEMIVAGVNADKDRIGPNIAPIVHAPKAGADQRDPNALPEVIYGVAERIEPMLVAVPERELGPGLFASANMVRRIRNALDRLPFYQPLHLLGTGNPWSIAIYSAAGADSFDGLEWCRMAADSFSKSLYHAQLLPLFTEQDVHASSPVAREALADPNVGFAGKLAFHNLEVLSSFNAELQASTKANRLEALVAVMLGPGKTPLLKAEVPDLFE
jgi:hypothetical protein